MKMMYCGRGVAGLVCAGLILPSVSARALDVADATGQWQVINFSMPSRLTVQRNSQGVVTDINEALNFERSTGSLTVSSDGSFSGYVPDPISGTMLLGAQGEMIVNGNGAHGPMTMTFHVNSTGDFMTTCGNFADGFNDLILALRSPATLNVSDLAGQWNAVGFKAPHHLVLERNSSNEVINIQGLNSFETFGGTLTVNADGTMSGQMGDAFTGTVDSAANGLVNITVNNEGGSESHTLFVNASKDVMAILESYYDTSENRQEVLIFQKAPTNNVTSDLAGQWRVVVYDAPMATQTKDAQGRVTGLSGSTSFGAFRQRLVTGYDGFFTGQFGTTVTGTGTPAGSGQVTINVLSGGSDTLSMQLNSSQTLLSSSRSIGDGFELLISTHSAPATGPVRDFGLITLPDVSGMTVYWAAMTNGALQVSTNFSDWQTLSGTVGQHSYSAPAGGGGMNYYRVTQMAP
jgi:hypothetical protein